MPGPKHTRRERTEEWARIKQWTLWPEQEWYEAIRPLVLFHETAGERAKEIDVPQRTLSRKADWPSSGSIAKDGASLPSPTISEAVVTPSMIPSSAGWRKE